jgi:hypothetical protein
MFIFSKGKTEVTVKFGKEPTATLPPEKDDPKPLIIEESDKK